MRALLFVPLVALIACSSVPLQQSLDRVQSGMDKSAVLDSAGNPKRTYRERGEDHWIYVYFEGDRELSREVVFEGGKVARVTKPRAKANWDKEIEGARSADDSGFKSVDGPAN
jgi:hypothetical protein